MENGIFSFDQPVLTNRREKQNFSKTQLDELPLTMVYAPMQPFSTKYEPEKSLMNGTLFEDLDKPFEGRILR